MNCPYCHQKTEDAAAFCTKCGRKIPRCPTCGEVITARIRFCTRDGTLIPEELTRDLPELEGTVVEPSMEGRNTPDKTANSPLIMTDRRRTTTRKEPPVERTKAPEKSEQRPPEQEKTQRKPNGSTIAFVVGVVVVLALLLAVVLWVWTMLGGSDSETVEEGQTSIVEENDETETDEEQADDGAEDATDETEDETNAEETEETEQTEQLDISLTTNSLVLYEGMTHQIIGANADQVSWTYSEPGIVEVDGSGQLTAQAAGTTVATATGPNGETASVEVTVLALETEETEEAEEQESTESADEESTDADLSGDYVLPNSSSEYLSESDLYGLTEWECRIARNEIYARHGVIFASPELQEYFESKSWYQGTIENAAFDSSVFNEYELANVYLIKDYEKEMNYNQAN